ncbi:membrane protein [Betaproteobacteria bacterium]|nr:membrane protein [Betaproteobacteria bacterium]GHU11571.1 membrane protein [Betaproteobacteria bacterium]GHU26847.1 membrane protein [Betaproteobacteria bacterium]
MNAPALRSPRDRLRQVVLFEASGLLLIAPPFAWASGEALSSSIGMLAVLSLIAALWNAAFNMGFDYCEARLARRRADQRPLGLRVLHALAFEGGVIVLTLPVIMLWTGLNWQAALAADIGLALAYVVYAFFFHLAYDRCFPLHR